MNGPATHEENCRWLARELREAKDLGERMARWIDTTIEESCAEGLLRDRTINGLSAAQSAFRQFCGHPPRKRAR